METHFSDVEHYITKIASDSYVRGTLGSNGKRVNIKFGRGQCVILIRIKQS